MQRVASPLIRRDSHADEDTPRTRDYAGFALMCLILLLVGKVLNRLSKVRLWTSNTQVLVRNNRPIRSEED
ncbi:hypothetical protein TNCV_923681 [Trichonephila clavipes]|nr:hypothetical protein TNCV_923681 [Trichonephila clavipes]